MKKAQTSLRNKLKKLMESLSTRERKTIQLRLLDIKYQNQDTEAYEEDAVQLKMKVTELVPFELISKYRQLECQTKENKSVVEIVKRGRYISVSLDNFLREDPKNLDKAQECFEKAIQSINQFQNFAISTDRTINFNAIRQQVYLQMLAKFNAEWQNSEIYLQSFQSVIESNRLPLKKDQTRKQKMPSADNAVIVSCLHHECCLLTIQRYISSLIQKQQTWIESKGVMQLFWQQLSRTVSYLFIETAELRNLEEPAWMFEYLQQALNANYKYFIESICHGIRADISNALNHHFLNSTCKSLMLNVILKRIQADLPHLNSFLIFNFFDELGQFQLKMQASFGVKTRLIEPILIKLSANDLLTKILSYEDNWFQTKIFDDFLNIDYSKVNLKNLDAFNVVTNFLSLFERLHRKYAHISLPTLREQISVFYKKQVLNVIAHVKTSFDRIYNHSKLPKIEVLLSFKRVENQLRTNLGQFLSQQRDLQENLQRQYYQFLQQYFETCALEAVGPTHKKLHISLGDIMQHFSASEDQGYEKYINSFGVIFAEWNEKMDQILKFSTYSDSKIRTIFFTYLQATSFSPVGLNLYLKIFEPYLRMLYSEDRHCVLLSLSMMENQSFSQYIESHPEVLSFLTSEEKRLFLSFKKGFITAH